MKYNRQKFCEASDKVKLDIVKGELRLVTHNGTTKEDLLMLLDWTYNRLIKGDLENKDTPMKCGYGNGYYPCPNCGSPLVEEKGRYCPDCGQRYIK